jgi:hypothetical protein
MGINDEYSRDAYNYELAYDSDESDETPDPLHPEDWQDWYSEQLLDAWMTIRQYAEDNYINLHFNYPQFVEFVQSSGAHFEPIETPNPIAVQLWNAIKGIQVIKEFVQADSFFNWVEFNLDVS